MTIAVRDATTDEVEEREIRKGGDERHEMRLKEGPEPQKARLLGQNGTNPNLDILYTNRD